MSQKKVIERIISLSTKALSEKDSEKFTSCLKERAALVVDLTSGRVEVTEEVLKSWLEVEQGILNRLEEERRNVLKKMDELSKRRTATHQYVPKFPFPSMPVFFDKIG